MGVELLTQILSFLLIRKSGRWSRVKTLFWRAIGGGGGGGQKVKGSARAKLKIHE